MPSAQRFERYAEIGGVVFVVLVLTAAVSYLVRFEYLAWAARVG